MVQPGSATVIWPGACHLPDALSATTVTSRMAPRAAMAVISTGTSAIRCSPCTRPPTLAGTGVVTPAPRTLTVTTAAGSRIMPGPSFTRVTRTICKGCDDVPLNNSVEATSVIRMPHRGTLPPG